MAAPYLYSHLHTTLATHNPEKMTHVHDFVELVYCTGGEGSQITPAGLQDCRPGDLFCFLPGEAHLSYCRSDQTMDLSVVYYGEDCFRNKPDSGEWYGEFRRRIEERASRRIPLNREGRSAAEEIFTLIPREFSRHSKGRRSMVLSHLTRFMLFLLRAGGPGDIGGTVPSGRDRIAHFLLYLEVNYQQEMSVDFALEFCHMSRSRFHALFREVAGTGFITCLNRLRIEKAAERLGNDPDLSVQSIAESCGFNEISHFCHQFKRFRGCSPREWRSNAPR